MSQKDEGCTRGPLTGLGSAYLLTRYRSKVAEVELLRYALEAVRSDRALREALGERLGEALNAEGCIFEELRGRLERAEVRS